MNINYLETFVSVVHSQSIHKAAEALFLSQPTVSARIKALERELDTELFVRRGRGLLLTEQGEKFIPYAENIIRKFEEGKKSIKKRNAREEIVIGANIITSQYFIPFALPLWKHSNPHLHFKFISASSDVLFEKLFKKKVDLAFTKQSAHVEVRQRELLDNSVTLVVHPEHPFRNEARLTVDRLAEEVMVICEYGAFDWNRVHMLFEAAKLEPRIEFQVNHLEVAKSMIKNGHAIGFLPRLCMQNELASGGLIEIDVTHLFQLEQHVFLSSVGNESNKGLVVESILASTKSFINH